MAHFTALQMILSHGLSSLTPFRDAMEVEQLDRGSSSEQEAVVLPPPPQPAAAPAAATSLLGPAPALPNFSTRADWLAQTLDSASFSTSTSTSTGPSSSAVSTPVMPELAEIHPELASMALAKEEFQSALQAMQEGRVPVAAAAPAQKLDLEAALQSLVHHLSRLQDLTLLHNSSTSKAPTPAALSRSPSAQQTPQSSAPTLPPPPSSLDTLGSIGLTASALKQSAREVVLAEQELLWSCVDDLLVQVSWLCRPLAAAAAAGSNNAGPAQSEPSTRQRRTSLESTSEYSVSDLLPVYTSPRPADPHSPEGHAPPPGYAVDEKRDHSSEAALPAGAADDDDDEKAQVELHHISSAVERLYGVSPQLANQRAAAPNNAATSSNTSKQELREAQLLRLGLAIERLSKGRLEDQRAVLAPTTTTAAATGKRRQTTPEQELDSIMDAMDKASAGSSMANQRVALSDRQTWLLVRARKTAQEAAQTYGIDSVFGQHLEPAELARRQHILDRTGHGRIASQDAPFSPPSASSESSSSADGTKERSKTPPSTTGRNTNRPSSAGGSGSGGGSLRKRFSQLIMGSGETSSQGAFADRQTNPFLCRSRARRLDLNESSGTDHPFASGSGDSSLDAAAPPLCRPRAQTYTAGQAQALARN